MVDEKSLLEYLGLIPKVELHAHLNGCIRSATLKDLAREREVDLPDILLGPDHENHSMYNLRPRSLQDCFALFAELPKLINDLSALRRITREALQDFADHHVCYVELRSTPKALPRDYRENIVATKKEYIETVLEVAQSFEEDEQERYKVDATRLPLVCRVLVSVDRSRSVEEAHENIDLAIQLRQEPRARVVGVDLGGNPMKGDFSNFRSAFERARAAGLKVTLHCAETQCGTENAIEKKAYDEAAAMLDFQPDRLGHALLLSQPLLNRLYELKIPVETCPTSNVMTIELAHKADGGLVHGLRQHPALKDWLHSNLPIAFCTDDPGVFDTTATKELVLVATAFQLDPVELATKVEQSMECAFCDPHDIQSIRKAMRRVLSTTKMHG